MINPPKITKISEQSSVMLDLTRAMAAILVFLTHFRYLFFVDFSGLSIHKNGAILKLFYFFTSIGHESVMVFFVLSGYFISVSTFKMRERHQWDWGNYAIARLVRLYIVLIPALAMGALLDIMGPRIFGPIGLYSPVPSTEYSGMYSQPIAATTTLNNWLGCLFFLQYIRCAPFGSNGPLWSLSYEFWYYVLFPLLLGIVYSSTNIRKSWSLLLVNAIPFLGIFWFIGPSLRSNFCIWMLGVAVCIMPPPKAKFLRGGIPLGLSFALLFVTIAVLKSARFRSLSPDIPSLAIGLSFAIVLYFCIHGFHHTILGVLAKPIRFLASISYSLYLFHVPVLVFLSVAIFKGGSRWTPDVGHLLLSLIVVAITFCYTILMWRFTEANTDLIRKRLVEFKDAYKRK